MKIPDPADAVLTLEEACRWREELRRAGLRLAVTNGCFDIMHRGHAAYLREAREVGDALLVLVNSDASVRALKGDKRPIVGEQDRMYMLCSLKSVDRAVLFDSPRCDRELAALAPDFYVKGGDYTPEKLDPAERAALERSGTRLVFKPFIPGCSTTAIVERILKLG